MRKAQCLKEGGNIALQGLGTSTNSFAVCTNCLLHSLLTALRILQLLRFRFQRSPMLSRLIFGLFRFKAGGQQLRFSTGASSR
jgi:hypothetical protein